MLSKAMKNCFKNTARSLPKKRLHTYLAGVRGTVWGGEQEMLALSMALQKFIVLFLPNRHLTKQSYGDTFSQNIHIAALEQSGHHYVAVVPQAHQEKPAEEAIEPPVKPTKFVGDGDTCPSGTSVVDTTKQLVAVISGSGRGVTMDRWYGLVRNALSLQKMRL